MAENREKITHAATTILHQFTAFKSISELRNFIKNYHASETVPIGKTVIERKLVQQILQNQNNLKKILEQTFSLIADSNLKSNISVFSDVFGFILKDNEEILVLAMIGIIDIRNKIKERTTTHSIRLIAEALEYLLKEHIFTQVFWRQCLIKPTQSIRNKHIYAPSIQQHWDILIKNIISLPDVVANQLKLGTQSIFLPATYTTILSQCIIETLVKVHNSIQNSQDCSLHFLNQLIGKLCIRGNAEIMYDILLPQFAVWVTESPLWCRICSKCLMSVCDNHLEATLVPLLSRYESLDLLNHVLSSVELESHTKLQFLLTNKLLFLKTFSNELTPYLILNYLKSSEGQFKKVLLKLLKVWGDQGSMQNTSLDQHKYLTKSIVICLSLLSSKQKKEWKDELIMKLLETVQSHFESPNEQIRILGMIVAELVTSTVDTDGKHLNFDLERTEEIELYYRLAKDPLLVIRERQEQEKKEPSKKLPTLSHQFDKKHEEKEEEEINEELDSDDEFEPINVKNGKEEDENIGSVNGVQPPLYLRDCISGLLSSKEPDRLEASLNALEKLVKREPGDLKDVSIELLRILLHLEDEYNITNFYTTKQQATLAIVCKCPAQASEYLCDQFFEENYTINQRLDILEIISSSATILSKPESDDPDKFRKKLPKPKLQFVKDGSENEEKQSWKEIVDERIEQKTRRFNSGKRKSIESKENRLSTVVGSFFFPLMKKFGMNLQASQLLSSEPMLLGKYVYTLAVVLQAAQDLPVIVPMSKALLELIWALRFHKEAFVRQALIFGASKIILHVPPFILMSEMQNEILETKSWLEEVIERDPDKECQKMAISSIVLLQKLFQKELIGSG